MSGTPKQLILDLAPRPALGAEDFLPGPAHADALGMIDRWPDWGHWALLIQGPSSSGKSHLASVWQYRAGGGTVAASDLSTGTVERLKDRHAIVIEDLHSGISDEQMLFHLLNVAREHQLSVLMTSRLAPGDLDVAFPDLRSRLRAVPVVAIGAPDDALLRALLIKQFSDRQLNVDPAVIELLAMRMERSFAAVGVLVEAIDRRALATKRAITRVLAREVLAEFAWVGRTEAGSAEGQDVDD
jgi:chromosomal replication initiation ATPase DnaA